MTTPMYVSISSALVSSQFESGTPDLLWENAAKFICFFCCHLAEWSIYKKEKSSLF
jgi:hypothetical protein